jgi:methylglutamate dehydrogenase subunit D
MANRGQMAEVKYQRASVLGDLAVQGRFGADKGAPGVVLSVIHPFDMVMVIARKGQGKALASALSGWRGLDWRWAGPDQYYVLGKSVGDVRKKLDGFASCTDQSHGRMMISVEGRMARAVLAKGMPVDLHTREFQLGKSAVTQMAHVGVHLTRVGEDAFELSVFRGFAESFWEWLISQSEEFGYQVV